MGKGSDKDARDESAAAEHAAAHPAETFAEATGERAAAPAGPEPIPIPGLRALDRALGQIEHVLVAASLLALIFVGTYQSVASHIFDSNASWPFEIIRYAVFFVAMSGAALAAQRQRMISMDFVCRLLPPRGKVLVRLAIGVFVVFLCVLLYQGGMQLRDGAMQSSEPYEHISPATGLLALPFGAALIALHYALHVVIDALYLARGELPPTEDEGPRTH